MNGRGIGCLGALLLLAGCASSQPVADQRTTQGPTALDFFAARVMTQSGRAPNFEERRHFEDTLEDRIGRYLREHEDAANDYTLSSFRFLKQPTAGMRAEQVEILLGVPESTTQDAAQMQNLARRHWPELRGKVDEAWSYPLGWVFYFSKARLVDMTQYLPPPPR